MSVQVGSAFGKIEIDFSGVKRGVDAAVSQLSAFEKATKRIGGQLKSAGDEMTAAITLPLVAAGVAASKMGMEFEESMQHIVGLVGISQRQVNEWSQDLRAMGPELGRAPRELSEALYQVTSSGVESGKALEVVRQSAKAAASGLGETQVVADAITSAMNAYRTSNLEASKATDILVATVREGKSEAAAIAPALGRAIPVAAELGISFDQVGAALAGMTLVGFDAAESATNLSGIMSAFLKPSKQAAEVLAQFGLSGEQLREMAARPGGLLDVLTLLRDTVGQDDEALAKIFPNVRGFRGMLALVGENAEQVSGIFGRLANATGDADRAFQASSQTAKFQFDQAMSGVQSNLIALGNAILPVVIPILKELSETLRRVTEWFTSLDRNTQQTIVQIGLIAVAIGPVLSIGGRLISTLGTVVSLMTSLGGALGTAAKLAGSFARTGFEVVQYLWEAGAAGAAAAASIGLIVAGLIAMIKVFEAAARAAKATNDELIKMANSDTGNVIEDAFNRAGASIEIVTNGSNRLRGVLDATHQKIQAGARDYNDYRSSIEATARAAGYEINAAGDLVQVMSGMGGRIERVVQAQYALNKAQYDGLRASRGMVDETERLAWRMSTIEAAADDQAKTLSGLGDATQEAIDKANEYAEAQRKAADESAAAESQLDQLRALIGGEVGTTYDEFKTAQDELREKMAALRDEQKKLQDSYGDHSKRLSEIKGEFSDLNTALQDNAAAYDERLKRILFDMATEQVAADGLTATEANALTMLAEKWGLIDAATADATRNVLGATAQLAQDQNIEAFSDRMNGALDKVKERAERTPEEIVGPIGMAYAEAARLASMKGGEVARSAQTMAGAMQTQAQMARESFGVMTSGFVRDSDTAARAIGDMAIQTQTAMGSMQNIMAQYGPNIGAPLKTGMQTVSDDVITALNGILDKVREVIEAITGINVPNIRIPTVGGGGGTNSGGSPGGAPKGVNPKPTPRKIGRARGGTLFPGVPYLLNESGFTRPEVIVPQMPGYALTRQDAMAALSRAAALNSPVSQPIYVTVPVGQISNDIDMEMLALRVAEHIRRRR
jgi:TP901 family phage tail tape measure protein